jgi:integrase
MQELRKRPGSSALALEVIILTNCRTNEALQATWTEFDFDAALWTIPAGRMKGEKEHFIPLSDPALAVFRLARAKAGESAFVFPGARSKIKPLSNMACLELLKQMGHGDVTVHGFRSSFRDWAGESTSHAREVIEHAMSHQLKDKAEAAYARGTMLERRRGLMAHWAAYCAQPALTPGVVPIRSTVA